MSISAFLRRSCGVPLRAAAIFLALTAVPAALLGCGTEEPKGPSEGGPEGDRYLPLAIGSSWSYLATDPDIDESTDKKQTVEALEEVEGKPGTMAYRLRTDKVDGVTVSWQEDRGVEVTRHREHTLDLGGNLLLAEVYDPGKLRIDERPEHTTLGAKYSQSYTETATDAALAQMVTVDKQEEWTVEAVDEQVTVPAGTFSCLKLRRASADPTQATKTFYFAKGVGKVKELGGQVEELASYKLAGGS